MPLSTFTSLLHLVLLATAASLQFTHMETGKFSMRSDFRAGEQVKGDVYHEVVFAVKQKNLDQLEKIFYEVSDPKNPKYGKYLTRQQVADLSSNMAGTQAVSKFLADQGVTIVKTSPYGEYITAMAPVSTWNTLFDTTFAEYHNLEGKRNTVLRCPHYSLPTDLVEHVEGVFNTVQLPPRVPIRSFTSNIAKARSGLNTTAAGTVTPAFLNSYYHITSNTGNTLSTQSLFESLGQYYSPADLSQFQTQYNIPQQAVSENIGEQGPNDQACKVNANNCIEANLDVQYIMAVAQVNPTTYWYDGSADSFLNWIQAVAADPDPPLVHSISYGAIEDQMPTLPLTRFNQEAMKLGTQGITITVSSGDDGVANFNARGDPKECGYHPSFPATSPYVTAVGATQGPESGNPEIACQSNEKGIITTGGGFSTVFSAPSWQTATISNYFKVATKPASGYSTTGRGYPDVAMAGFNYEVVVGGETLGVSGTSASSPVVAGMVALVNAARLAAGKPALGFLNQAIYQFGTKFTNDITSGENNCAASSVPATATCCTEGFYAAAGWDPLTGFGSVDYAKFYQTFYNL